MRKYFLIAGTSKSGSYSLLATILIMCKITERNAVVLRTILFAAGRLLLQRICYCRRRLRYDLSLTYLIQLHSEIKKPCSQEQGFVHTLILFTCSSFAWPQCLT